MSMYSLPFLSELANQLSTTAIDDSVDTLHCFITAFLFVSSALLISFKTYAGTPIECWVPQTYSGAWVQFSKALCFHKNTYWYPSDESFFIPEDHKNIHRLYYYQWSSMYLTMACALFVFPKFVWNFSQHYTNVSLSHFCQEAYKIRFQLSRPRKLKINELVDSLIDKLHAGAVYRRLRLIFMFILVKVLYLSLAIGQFFFLAFFLGQRTDIFWGWKLFNNLLNGVTWKTTGMFPRVTFCDFHVREMAGNNREETIECLMGLNEFNEKIFLFLWFWLLFVIGVSCLGIMQDMFLIYRNNIVTNLLYSIRNKRDKKQQRDFNHFVNNFIGYDGKLVIHFVKRQSALIAEELVLELYKKYLEYKE